MSKIKNLKRKLSITGLLGVVITGVLGTTAFDVLDSSEPGTINEYSDSLGFIHSDQSSWNKDKDWKSGSAAKISITYLNEYNEVFVYGNSEWKQLGDDIADQEFSSFDYFVDQGINIVSTNCGPDNCYFFADDDRIFATGRGGSEGTLSGGISSRYGTPLDITTQISAIGDRHAGNPITKIVSMGLNSQIETSEDGSI